jgi:two-component system sensor histidine kinase DesK
LTAAGVRFEIEGLPAAGSLRPAEETVLALALREAVTNVVRHAQAQTCRLRFNVQNGRHSLTIEDDGQHTMLREGNGLRGMRERVESLGGTFQLEREHGTRLLIELPAAGSAS